MTHKILLERPRGFVVRAVKADISPKRRIFAPFNRTKTRLHLELLSRIPSPMFFVSSINETHITRIL